jgi:hypothetical protein
MSRWTAEDQAAFKLEATRAKIPKVSGLGMRRELKALIFLRDVAATVELSWLAIRLFVHLQE